MNIIEEVTCFIVSSGINPNYSYCVEALKSQTVKVNIELIKDYHPMSLAFQEMLVRCKTPYYIQVDEDMILENNAIELMYSAIKASKPNISMIAFLLHDVHIDYEIYGVKIYKYEIFKNYPYNLNCISCEREQIDRLKKDGYTFDTVKKVIGKHSPHWNNDLIFLRYFDLMEKSKKYGYFWLEYLPNRLLEIFKKDTSEKNLYAFLGAYTSMINEKAYNQEKDFTQVKMKECGILESYLSYPITATIYLTNKCNFQCEWCFRQHNDVEISKDMDVATVELMLKKFPTIKSVCICGLGEPFTNINNLKWIVKTLKDKKIFVGLITNGSLLYEKLSFFEGVPVPDYISVSLNAANAEQHKNITKTDAFDVILKGISKSLEWKIDTYVSYVCTKNNIKHIPEFLNLVESIGVKTVHLHNLLPHYKEENNDLFWEEVLQKKDIELIENIKKLPNANLIKGYPILIDRNEARRNCKFPWNTLLVDGDGNISICNSVYPPSAKNGNLRDECIWVNSYCTNLRKSILDDQLPACKKCFRNWA